MYFNNKFYHGIMFHNFHDEKLHKKSQGSISKDNFYKIIEIPVTWMERNTGKSRFKLISFILPYTKWLFYIIKTTIFYRNVK